MSDNWYYTRSYDPFDLVCGYTNGVINFTHKPYAQRSGVDRSHYDNLGKHLLKHGMFNPLITFQGHVLIGQRRFEILRDVLDEFPCWEINTDMARWGHPQVTTLIKKVNRAYLLRNRERGVSI